MSSRSSVKSAFQGLRPSIVREPARSVIAPEDESKLLEAGAVGKLVDGTEPVAAEHATAAAHSTVFPNTKLLSKKKRDVLIPVTFRIPQTLKEKLNEIAKKHELNQTDLINEGIELNLQRYQ